MSTPTTPARPPYDPELGAMLTASPLLETITPDTIEPLRAGSFTELINKVLSTHAAAHAEKTSPIFE